MFNQQKNFSEKNFQENFVREMTKYKWRAPDELDGNKQTVTVGALVEHWRSELNRINADVLERIELSDGEFAQVMAKVKQINNSFEAAKILSMETAIGKIDGIVRDVNAELKGQQITLTIFKKAEVSGGDSSYKIAREISTSNGNRFDIVLLINGLPLINIEQKRADKSLNEAFNQFKRYYADGEYVNNFMAFSQMMVITSEVATRYFATPKSINDFNPSFVFGWADKNNIPINNWQEIVKHFLMIPMAHQLVGDYLIIDEAQEQENKKHMIMRPYQVYALQAVEGAALGWDNEDKIPHGGYVWHTTGSGKTITSFKTALFLSTRGNFDKVVFLVDRKELDKKTSENFKAYAVYDAVKVDDTKHTYHLHKELKGIHRGIIVTTTHKLSSLVEKLQNGKDFSLAEKKLVFIVDEAHRSTMGKMMKEIKEYFRRNSLFFGYTGTPLFDENKVTGMINEKSELINTTEKLFGPELHKYTIDQAIADGNVLGFHVDYINTGEFRSYEDLREQLIEKMLGEKPAETRRKIERIVQGWEDLRVEKEAKSRGLLAYYDKNHIPRVVEEILTNWEEQSQNKHFNAILTVAYKKRVIAYYEEFKKQQEKLDKKINIVMTFSFGSDEEGEAIAPEIIKMMFEDYAEFTQVNFSKEDNKLDDADYFEDIVARLSRGGSGRNPKNIDLVIVADRLLTGYDSKYLNTLYIDRELKLQSLIQAYSRTNRIYGKSKEFGSVVNFQYPKSTKEQVDLALKLYGSGGTSSKVIMDDYKTAISKLNVDFKDLVSFLPDPTTWEELQNNSEKKEAFLLFFRAAANQLNTVMQYYEYEWDTAAFGLDEGTWLKYVGACKNLTRKDDDSVTEIIPPLVDRTKLSGTQVITAQYILELIGSKVKIDIAGKQTVDPETLRIIYEQIQELSNLGEDEQAKLLKQFVQEDLIPGKLSGELGFDEAFDKWKKKKVQQEIEKFSKHWGLHRELLAKTLKEFSLAKKENIPFIEELNKSADYKLAEVSDTKDKLDYSIERSEALPLWLVDTKRKYFG